MQYSAPDLHYYTACIPYELKVHLQGTLTHIHKHDKSIYFLNINDYNSSGFNSEMTTPLTAVPKALQLSC